MAYWNIPVPAQVYLRVIPSESHSSLFWCRQRMNAVTRGSVAVVGFKKCIAYPEDYTYRHICQPCSTGTIHHSGGKLWAASTRGIVETLPDCIIAIQENGSADSDAKLENIAIIFRQLRYGLVRIFTQQRQITNKWNAIWTGWQFSHVNSEEVITII